MTDARTLLAGMLDGTVARVHRALADVSEEDARAGPQGLTPIVWQVGHIALTDSRALTRWRPAGHRPTILRGVFRYGHRWGG